MQIQAEQKNEVRITFGISVSISLIFTALIWILGPRLVRLFEHLPDQVYFGGLIAAYSFRGFGQIYEIAFIPAGLYGETFALLLIAWLIKALTKPKGLSG